VYWRWRDEYVWIRTNMEEEGGGRWRYNEKDHDRIEEREWNQRTGSPVIHRM
jgi:hypothetical protein